MKRVTLPLVLAFGIALLVAPAAFAAKDKLMANAMVKAVTQSSLTVTVDGKESTFTVDKKTRVVGKGIGTKTAAKGGKATIVDLLSTGDKVTITYQDMGTAMHAGKVELITK